VKADSFYYDEVLGKTRPNLIVWTNSNELSNWSFNAADYQSITDVVGQKGMYNPVSHYKHIPQHIAMKQYSQFVAWPNEDAFTNTTTSYYYGMVVDGASAMISGKAFFSGQTYPPSIASYPAIDWTSLVSQVGDRLSGTMDAKSNILVTIGEGIKTLAMFKSPFKALTSLTTHGSKTIKDLVHAGASSQLEYIYGWRSLYNDIVALITLHHRVKTHINNLRAMTGVEQRMSTRQVDGSGAWPWRQRSYQGCKIEFRISRIERVAVFSAHYVLDEAVNHITAFEHYMDALGVKNVAEAVWDLVPYSFVVDWFINFNKILRRDPTVQVREKLTHVGYSVKTSYYGEFKSSFSGNNFWNGVNPSGDTSPAEGAERLIYQSYTRTRGFPPSTLTAGWFGSLSQQELANGAALILQRI
jgi:hypothetical protein